MTGRGGCLSDAYKSTQRVNKCEETERYVPNEKQNKILEQNFNEPAVGISPDKELKVMVKMMLIKLRKI